MEQQRQVLACVPEFQPLKAFNRIDRDGSGVITTVQLLRFLRQNGVSEAMEADCYQIVKYFDGSNQNVMRYTDFL